MSDTELLIEEVRSLPEAYVHEAIELITALKQKRLREQESLSSELPDLGSYLAENSPRTIKESLQIAEAKAADPNRKPFQGLGGSLKNSPHFGRSGVAIQREMRSEWDRQWDAAAHG
jgi:hypothetical protein